MAEDDRARWDRIFREGGHADAGPPDWLAELDAELPRDIGPRADVPPDIGPQADVPKRDRALDVASGAGRVALFWAARGLETLAVDISVEALDRARHAASRAGLALETRALDLESEPLPDGPFAAISCFHYLQRDLFPALAARLAPGGVLACEIATLRNLERNPRPSRRFLLEPNELLRLCAPLEIAYYREGWQGGRCTARLLARRPSPSRAPVTSSS